MDPSRLALFMAILLAVGLGLLALSFAFSLASGSDFLNEVFLELGLLSLLSAFTAFGVQKLHDKGKSAKGTLLPPFFLTVVGGLLTILATIGYASSLSIVGLVPWIAGMFWLSGGLFKAIEE